MRSRSLALIFMTVLSTAAAEATAADTRPLNVLLFTADDLNCDSLGCYGSQVAEITPNLDRFAAEALRFTRAHVTVAICQPSRGVLATGRYPHRSGIMGFMHTERDIPTVMQTFRDHGYLTGVLGKVKHSTPHANYEWDFVHDQPELGGGRSPTKYAAFCREFFQRCRDEERAFYFMVNSHDPHRPYHIPAGGKPHRKLVSAEPPSRLYEPAEVQVPGFLPDLAGVRLEASYYFNSVRRLDDTFGAVMRALDESGMADNTLVIFLSDNGIAMPFAKCNAYLASTRTPWLVRWPRVVTPGAVDELHFISGIDFMPTVCEAAGISLPQGMDGRSFVPLLRGETQAGREQIHTQIDCKAGGDAVPMRCIQNAHYGYIFNGWADGSHRYRNNNEGLAMKAMQQAAASDSAIAERVRAFRFRWVEELYDLENDPDCLHNLIDRPEHDQLAARMRSQLREWMLETGDPLLPAFEKRDAPREMERIMWETYEPYRREKNQANRR